MCEITGAYFRPAWENITDYSVLVLWGRGFADCPRHLGSEEWYGKILLSDDWDFLTSNKLFIVSKI